MRTHTRVDVSLVDHKAKQVVEAYEKNQADFMDQLATEASETSNNFSKHSTQQNLTIEKKE